MSAPDRHWLLIKQYWYPIEELLKEACPDTETSQEQIDRLNGRLDASVVRQLHQLRRARNDVIHGNKPLPDALAFENEAVSAAQALQRLLGKELDLTRWEVEWRMRFNLAFWAMAFFWVYIATQGGDSTSHAPMKWKAMAALYSPLVRFVKTVIDFPFPLLSAALTIAVLSAVTSVIPRSLELALRIYILVPVSLALLAKAF
ncbi:MAG TPA: DUF4145 domain-containing protein [Ochrobactrum intermedium]|uniref:DUF4145 domain-containing protein n=1 Tax=Brucella intermedia TaxID=94625 RepID=A0A7V6U0W6_9HYPH|nr:hypothetical protein [Brucella intermedia]HHV69353.1 DUF4145 domain-containing protein [Brucella intermedia]